MIAQLEAHILALVDGMVAHASDDELFASSYLCGHLTLAVAESEENNEQRAEQLNARVQHSLDKAIKSGELSPPDQVLVLNMWGDLYQTALLAESSVAANNAAD